MKKSSMRTSTLRAVPGPDQQPVVVDLRRVAPSLEADMPAAARRFWPGLVFVALRERFPTAEAFRAAALGNARVDLRAGAAR